MQQPCSHGSAACQARPRCSSCSRSHRFPALCPNAPEHIAVDATFGDAEPGAPSGAAIHLADVKRL
eukprot:7039788-Prorocentrum_lima.AAC.1